MLAVLTKYDALDKEVMAAINPNRAEKHRKVMELLDMLALVVPLQKKDLNFSATHK